MLRVWLHSTVISRFFWSLLWLVTRGCWLHSAAGRRRRFQFAFCLFVTLDVDVECWAFVAPTSKFGVLGAPLPARRARSNWKLETGARLPRTPLSSSVAVGVGGTARSLSSVLSTQHCDYAHSNREAYCEFSCTCI